MAKLKNLTKKQQAEQKEENRRTREWKKAVNERDGQKCIICGKTKNLNTHHIIPREVGSMRHDTKNGVSLCPSHHRFNRLLSAHQNPLAFFIWLEKHRPQQYQYLKIRATIHIRSYKNE